MIIVKHTPTDKYYILLGASYSYYKDSRPSFMGGALFPHEEEGVFRMTAVSDEEGELHWIPSNELVVVKIDGYSPKTVLGEYRVAVQRGEVKAEEVQEECPGCGNKVKSSDRECPGCGLTLITEE